MVVLVVIGIIPQISSLSEPLRVMSIHGAALRRGSGRLEWHGRGSARAQVRMDLPWGGREVGVVAQIEPTRVKPTYSHGSVKLCQTNWNGLCSTRWVTRFARG